MLMKAIECRVRERELFQSMRCQVACDMRIIGRDRENRPVIYLSARSQSEHLRELIPHVFLAFEVPTKTHPFFFGKGQRSWTFYVCLFSRNETCERTSEHFWDVCVGYGPPPCNSGKLKVNRNPLLNMY